MLLFFLGVTRLNAQLVLNEIQTTNVSTIADEDGDHPDWLELRNNSGAPLNLSGYALSDELSNPNKWFLPIYTMPVGSRLLVFASSKDRAPSWLGVDHVESLVEMNQGMINTTINNNLKNGIYLVKYTAGNSTHTIRMEIQK